MLQIYLKSHFLHLSGFKFESFEKNAYHYKNFRYIRVIDDEDILCSVYKGKNNNHNKLLSAGRNVLLHMICLLWIIELRFRLSMKIREKRKHIIIEMGRAHKRIIFRCLHHFYNCTWTCTKFS